VVSVNNFTYGLLNPALAYAMSCVGGYLGLRCVTLARAYTGMARARWLCLAAVAIGAIGIWAMHFIAMLGFSVPGEPILYNVPLTAGSMLLAVAVVGAGLFIVGFGDTWGSDPSARLLVGGVVIGIGVAAMHYLGMSAMSMPGAMSYNVPLVVVSVLIAVVAGTAALWIGTWIRGAATVDGRRGHRHALHGHGGTAGSRRLDAVHGGAGGVRRDDGVRRHGRDLPDPGAAGDQPGHVPAHAGDQRLAVGGGGSRRHRVAAPDRVPGAAPAAVLDAAPPRPAWKITTSRCGGRSSRAARRSRA
jgi:NO-binding membrane sensor protein with MHYT domain